MKRLAMAVVVVAFLCSGVITLLADRGKARGWPNHGISAPGHPNHYASPRGAVHP